MLYTIKIEQTFEYPNRMKYIDDADTFVDEGAPSLSYQRSEPFLPDRKPVSPIVSAYMRNRPQRAGNLSGTLFFRLFRAGHITKRKRKISTGYSWFTM